MAKKGLLVIVLVVGFMMLSCGGNINKVKNGVFSGYDNTITIGNALENNDTLKGGEWGTAKMDGRDYVTYTVKYSNEQIQATLQKYIKGNSTPNLVATRYFFQEDLSPWYSARTDARLSQVTSMSPEEVEQAYNIFIRSISHPQFKDFFDPFEYPEILKDEYYGPYFMEHIDDLDMSWPKGWYTNIVAPAASDYFSPDYNIQNGMLVGDALERYNRIFSGQRENIELQKEIAATMLRLYSEYGSAQERFKAAEDEYKQIENSDMNPMFTIDSFEIILSFVMNQDDTFTINMLESWTELTLNCLDNLKVRFNAENYRESSNILKIIYEGFTLAPGLF
jgi:hypothetical protein